MAEDEKEMASDTEAKPKLQDRSRHRVKDQEREQRPKKGQDHERGRGHDPEPDRVQNQDQGQDPDKEKGQDKGRKDVPKEGVDDREAESQQKSKTFCAQLDKFRNDTKCQKLLGSIVNFVVKEGGVLKHLTN